MKKIHYIHLALAIFALMAMLIIVASRSERFHRRAEEAEQFSVFFQAQSAKWRRLYFATAEGRAAITETEEEDGK